MKPVGIAPTEEVRLALVMNGGVSLAVWMGGVVTEIARAVRNRHPVYRDLLALTGARARVDVICGTSAGGINGAALALALKCGTDISQLRDVWQERASFGTLLRDPSELDPPSLLDGNGKFLPALEDAFTNLYGKGPVDGSPIDLTLTATLLNARPKFMTDDLGTAVEDAEHRARFHFSDSDFKSAGPVTARRLAFAARATASFPMAFEPVYCKVEDGTPPDDDNYFRTVDFKNSRFLIDGGVLDNKPFEAALQKIFNLPVRGPVRRVLAYIVPDPGITATADADDPEKPPGLSAVAMASIYSIPSAETITGQLDEIKEHNQRVHKTRYQVIGLMKTLVSLRSTADNPSQFPRVLFDMYYRRRVTGALDYILDVIEEEARKGIGRRTRAWIKEVLLSHYREAGFGDVARWVPMEWPDAGLKSLSQPDDWQWGLYTVEFFGSPLLDLLRRSERMLWLVERERGSGRPFPASPSNEDIQATFDFGDPDLPESQTPGDSGEGYLHQYWKRAYELLDKLLQHRMQNREFWQSRAKDLLKLLDTSERGDPANVAQWFMDSLKRPDQLKARSNAYQVYGQVALDIAALMLEVRNEVARERDAFKRISDTNTNRLEEKAEATDLLTMLEFLDRPNAEAVLEELLKLDVAQYALGERANLVADVAVELVQISGHSVSPLGMPPPLEQKLAGLQLAHFGAFYKKSWRANDWMHGRLDGSERLIHVILNPERLHRLYANRTWNGKKASQFVYEEVRRVAVDAVPGPEAKQELGNMWREPQIRDELAFLDSLSARVPERLDECCAAVTRRLHLGILHDEIPNVAASASLDQVDGAATTGVSAELIRELGTGRPSCRQLIHIWRNRSLGKEKIEAEFGSDLMTRTVSQTVAVSHSVLSSSQAGVGPLRLLVGALHLPVKLFYVLSNQLLRDSKSAAAVTLSLTTIGALLILLGLTVEKFPTSLSGFGWAVTAAGLGMAVLRAPRGGLIVGALALILTVFLLPLSLTPALAVLGMSVLIAVLWRAPSLIGALLVLGAAWATVGADGQEAGWTWLCQTSSAAASVGALCSEHMKPLNTVALGHAKVVVLSALAILGVWAAWSVLPRLVAFDRLLRKRFGG